MNTTESGPASLAYERYQQGYASSESESRHTSVYSGKKRPSRAGTRSVTTLSAAQLERKRANDREAQRAIRQRTKEHIEGLEKNVSDLQVAREASDQLAVAAQQRNRELEDEIAYLRTKLDEAGMPVTFPPNDHPHSTEQALLSAQTTSPAAQPSNPQRNDSTSTAQSAFSLPASQPSTSRHGSWQQNHSNLGPGNQSAHPSMVVPGPMQVMPDLSTWRSHDSSQSIQSAPPQLQDPSQRESPTPYNAPNANEPTQWIGPPQAYGYQEQPRPIKYEHPSQPPQQYVQTAGPGYSQQPAYHAPTQSPPAPPQAAFQGMTVSTPVTYQVPPPSNFPPPPHYQMSPVSLAPGQGGPTYGPQPGQMHALPPPPPPQPTAQQYHPAAVDPYAHHHIHPPMVFRDESGTRTYSLTHYPIG